MLRLCTRTYMYKMYVALSHSSPYQTLCKFIQCFNLSNDKLCQETDALNIFTPFVNKIKFSNAANFVDWYFHQYRSTPHYFFHKNKVTTKLTLRQYYYRLILRECSKTLNAQIAHTKTLQLPNCSLGGWEQLRKLPM